METQASAGENVVRPPAGMDAALEPDVQAHLGRQLRALYDEVASQPVPDRFRILLEQLEAKESQAKTKGGA